MRGTSDAIPGPKSPGDDEFNLTRFVTAQEGTYDRALLEIRRGRNASHWMWFIFPQLRGLGRSSMAQRFAISCLEEARQYLCHPVLGPRLKECLAALQDLVGTTAEQVFGPVDAMKLRSSLTLFAEAAGPDSIYAAALDRWFRGVKDDKAMRLLACA